MPANNVSLYKKLFVTRIIPETADAKTFVLEAEDATLFQYFPGQFLTLVFLHSGQEQRRSYSISSAPALNEPLAITVKRVPNGEYSRKLIDTAKEGDELISIRPSGFFTLPAEMEAVQEFVFLVAGSGITPVFSLIKTLLHLHPQKKILLIYSNRSPADTIFWKELKELAGLHPGRLRIEFLFSSIPGEGPARLSNYWLEILLKKHHVVTDAGALFYMCGPFDYMLMAGITLRAAGVPAANIKKESFSTFKLPPRQEPPDKAPHDVRLLIGEEAFDLQTQYPVSILQKAKQAGIDLPYSCEAGRCGTCVALCISGKVWMSNNEVLLDEELARGMILTCVGHAIGREPVVIRI